MADRQHDGIAPGGTEVDLGPFDDLVKAMVLRRPAEVESSPLHLEEVDVPTPKDDELLVRVEVCGVCRTDLHVVEGDLPPRLPSVIPGHEAVGRVVQVGGGVKSISVGDTVGIPWLHRTCGQCRYCRTARENLCEQKVETGYGVNGGYAEFAVAEEGFALRLPTSDPAQLAPLLCAGLIGYRALRFALPGPEGRIGFFGFGGSAHLALQIAAHLGYETVAYSRNPAHLKLAERLGATETVLTGVGTAPPRPPSLDGAVVFAPVGESVVHALHEVRKGGAVSVAAIHMTPIPPIDYDRDLFGDKKIVSVEGNTRADAWEFLELVDRLKLESTVSVRGLSSANEALADLKHGHVVGALVLDCRHG